MSNFVLNRHNLRADSGNTWGRAGKDVRSVAGFPFVLIGNACECG